MRFGPEKWWKNYYFHTICVPTNYFIHKQNLKMTILMEVTIIHCDTVEENPITHPASFLPRIKQKFLDLQLLLFPCSGVLQITPYDSGWPLLNMVSTPESCNYDCVLTSCNNSIRPYKIPSVLRQDEYKQEGQKGFLSSSTRWNNLEEGFLIWF